MQLAEIAADARKPVLPPAPTIGWIIDQYLVEVEQRKPGKNHAPLRASLHPVKDRLGHLRWDQLTQNEIDDYATARLGDRRWETHARFAGKLTGTVSPSTVRKDLRMLHAALNEAHARRYIPHEVSFRIHLSDAPPRDTWLTKAEVRRMVEACQRDESIRGDDGKVTYRRRDRQYLEAFILIAVATAARKEAILSLTWEQVHIPNDSESSKRLFGKKPGDVGAGAYIDFGAGSGNKRRPKMPVGDNRALMSYLVFGGDHDQPYVVSRRGKPVADVNRFRIMRPSTALP